jgi:hypothetical protein
MAIYTLPTTLKLGPECGIGQRRYDMLAASDTTGNTQVRVLAPPRWTMSLVQPERLTLAEANAWAALLVGLRGRVNVLAAWDVVRPAPLGTMRGALTLAALAAAGATTATVAGGAGQAGATLTAGDWLQIGTGLGSSQLVMLTDPATADGSGYAVVKFEPPLRQAYAAATTVAWDKPLAYYRSQSASFGWKYANRGLMATGMALDLLETWQ